MTDPSPLGDLLSGARSLINTPVVGYHRDTVRLFLSKKKGEPSRQVESSFSIEMRAWEIGLLGGLAVLAYAAEQWGKGQGNGQPFPDWVASIVPAAAVINGLSADINGQPGAGVGWTEIAALNPMLALVAFALPEPSSFSVVPNAPAEPPVAFGYIWITDPTTGANQQWLAINPIPAGWVPGFTQPAANTTSKVTAVWKPPVHVNLPPWWGIVLPTVKVGP